MLFTTLAAPSMGDWLKSSQLTIAMEMRDGV